MLGNAGQKISRIVELAEELYERVAELREQVSELRETSRETRDRVVELEAELAAQRALLEALAEAQGLDVESISSAAADEDEAAEPSDPVEAPSSSGREP
ncbi:MAG: DUF5798 family protein [Halobacteriales archaeon]